MNKQLQHFIGYNRIPLIIALGVVFFFLSTPSSRSIVLGFPLIFLGEAIRTWSSGYLEKNRFIQIQGPYSLIRNPLYLGNILISLGFSVMGNQLVAGIGLLFGTLLIHSATIKQEEQYLTKHFGEAYKAYSKNVPRLIPNVFWPDLVGFRWGLVLENREFKTWLGLIGGVFLLFLKAVLI